MPKPGLGDPTYRRNRAAVLAASDICHLCGLPGADSVDHLIPRSKGGDNSMSNLAPAHIGCNASRGAKSLSSMYRHPAC